MEVFDSSCCRGRLRRCSAIDQLGGLSGGTDSKWPNSYSPRLYPCSNLLEIRNYSKIVLSDLSRSH